MRALPAEKFRITYRQASICTGYALLDLGFSVLISVARRRRVPCKYSGVNIAFRVDQGSNPFYLEVLVEFEDGDGDLSAVDLMEAGCGTWTPMVQNWGALWRYNSNTGKALRAPFSLRLTSDSGKVLVANNVIPAGWKAGATYRSLVNYS